MHLFLKKRGFLFIVPFDSSQEDYATLVFLKRQQTYEASFIEYLSIGISYIYARRPATIHWR